MGMFDQAKDLYKLQKEAKKIKKELSNMHIEAAQDGVTVIINGEQQVIKVEISDEAKGNSRLETLLTEVFNKALKKSQEIAAEKMKAIMGNLGLPGIG
ncbi:MAG: YbaB/EbfC family nucleoid-associated protein [Candidatus Peregrinibacteria bacterium]|nr:YbaB/EbfC family nucleoid-associated protein [Candidatus Peregrinibacteria bacterium]MDZ4245049.1 YbaB/EbfC family nucleoid-associated protein [Candidatus Gracilibacteria bacterium]